MAVFCEQRERKGHSAVVVPALFEPALPRRLHAWDEQRKRAAHRPGSMPPWHHSACVPVPGYGVAALDTGRRSVDSGLWALSFFLPLVSRFPGLLAGAPAARESIIISTAWSESSPKGSPGHLIKLSRVPHRQPQPGGREDTFFLIFGALICRPFDPSPITTPTDRPRWSVPPYFRPLTSSTACGPRSSKSPRLPPTTRNEHEHPDELERDSGESNIEPADPRNAPFAPDPLPRAAKIGYREML